MHGEGGRREDDGTGVGVQRRLVHAGTDLEMARLLGRARGEPSRLHRDALDLPIPRGGDGAVGGQDRAIDQRQPPDADRPAALRLVRVGGRDQREQIREVELDGPGANDPDPRRGERQVGEANMPDHQRERRDAQIDALGLKERLGRLALGEPQLLEREPPGEEVQIDVLDAGGATRQLGDLRHDRPAHDLGQHPEEGAPEHHDAAAHDEPEPEARAQPRSRRCQHRTQSIEARRTSLRFTASKPAPERRSLRTSSSPKRLKRVPCPRTP